MTPHGDGASSDKEQLELEKLRLEVDRHRREGRRERWTHLTAIVAFCFSVIANVQQYRTHDTESRIAAAEKKELQNRVRELKTSRSQLRSEISRLESTIGELTDEADSKKGELSAIDSEISCRPTLAELSSGIGVFEFSREPIRARWTTKAAVLDDFQIQACERTSPRTCHDYVFVMCRGREHNELRCHAFEGKLFSVGFLVSAARLGRSVEYEMEDFGYESLGQYDLRIRILNRAPFGEWATGEETPAAMSGS